MVWMVNNERSTLISDEVSFVVKEEPLSDYATMRSILDPNYSQMAADSSSSMLFEEQKPRCRPRGSIGLIE
ncbi:unnamed protein product [Anisakis simplex]|uniref:Ovule protein n=1 Tax=Anisakis simplex TaxID=6269 RepID=A0A0M3JLJ8_ANISI|nr:unnamed protein product [Anisakis simplex]